MECASIDKRAPLAGATLYLVILSRGQKIQKFCYVAYVCAIRSEEGKSTINADRSTYLSRRLLLRTATNQLDHTLGVPWATVI